MVDGDRAADGVGQGDFQWRITPPAGWSRKPKEGDLALLAGGQREAHLDRRAGVEAAAHPAGEGWLRPRPVPRSHAGAWERSIWDLRSGDNLLSIDASQRHILTCVISPNGAVLNSDGSHILQAGPEAWHRLGWLGTAPDGCRTRYPAEIFGPLRW
ncbi:hypothetical protein JCM17961_50220 [Endothiovibrio diazotrophicus]